MSKDWNNNQYKSRGSNTKAKSGYEKSAKVAYACGGKTLMTLFRNCNYLRTFIDPAIVLSMFMLSSIFVIVCGILF